MQNLIIVPAEVFTQHVGTMCAEVICGKYDFHRHGFCSPKLPGNLIHIADKGFIIALAAVALCTKQVVWSQAHTRIPSLPLILSPMMEASAALMMAVGINGSTQAVIAVITELSMRIQNIRTPIT